MKTSRNRWLIGGATAVVSLVAVVASVATASAATPHHVSGKPVADAAPVARASSNASDSGRLGAVISTGLDAGNGGVWVICSVSVKDVQLPGTTFGFMLGQRRNGTITPTTAINEWEGSDLAPGFHAAEGPMTVAGGITEPMFGYYVGHPAKITIRAGGRTITASTAVWSHNRSVTVFWFDPDKVKTNTAVSNLAAYDSAGRQLPTGNSGIGLG